MYTERTHVLCPSTLVWCSLQVTRGDHEDNVCVLHAKFSCSCVQARDFLKNTRVELQKQACYPLGYLKFKSSCTIDKYYVRS